jgi:signal transduction histidine kinase
MNLKILSLTLFLSLFLQANSLDLSPKMEGLRTTYNLTIFEDKTKKMDIEDIKNVHFENNTPLRINKGISKSNWWLKLDIKNPTNKPIDWVLLFYYGQFDELQSWQYDNKKTLISHFLKGDHFVDSSQIPFSNRTTFEFNTLPEAQNTIYIKVSYVNSGMMELFHSIWTKEEYIKYTQLRYALLGGIIGALSFLLFYNIFIWFILRKKEYFWYNIYILGVIFAMMTFDQIGSHFIWNNSIFIMDMMPFASTIIIFVSFILFTREFLETYTRIPKIDKLLLGLIIINVITIGLEAIGQRYFAIVLLHTIAFSFILFPILGFFIWHKGYKIARGYIVASIAVSITIIIALLRITDLLQTSELVYWISRFGFIAEGILLSIALADRISILEKEHINEQNKVKHSLEEAKKTLESEVIKRTYEIAQLNSSLEEKVKLEVEKNKQQQKMMIQQSRHAQMGEVLSMIAHQWRHPLNNLSLIIQNAVFKYSVNKLDDDGISKLDIESSAQIRQMSNTIKEFRRFFLPDNVSVKYDINSSINDAISITKPLLDAKNISLTLDTQENINIVGFPTELGQAIANIITNSKDALMEKEMSNKSIKLSLTLIDNEAKITIEDNGGGVPLEILEKIFDPYFSTKMEKNGTGLGLYMTKIIVEDHMRGKLNVANSNNGFVVEIVLPRYTIE